MQLYRNRSVCLRSTCWTTVVLNVALVALGLVTVTVTGPGCEAAQLNLHQHGPLDTLAQSVKQHKTQHRHHHGQLDLSPQSPPTAVPPPSPVSPALSASLELDYEDDYEGDGQDDVFPQPGTYIPSNCSSCIQREELRKRNLEVIKDQILSKLGMRTAPNMTGRHPPRIPPLDHLLDLYGMQGDAPQKGFQPGPVYDEEEDDFHARTEKIIAFGQPLPHVRNALKRTESSSSKGMESMYFKFSDKVVRSKADKAHLWLYLNSVSSAQLSKNATVWIHVFKVVRVPQDESPVLNPVRMTRVALEAKGGWVSLEIRKVVADWFRWSDENLGLVVQVTDFEGKSLSDVIVTDPEAADGSLIPFLEVITTDSRKHRTKRTIGLNCDENSSETRCCRYPLTVDFVEFGWDWIIAPKKYEANYCSGECPYVFLQKYPHTHIVQQANPAGTAGPCCAPRKMSPISMLYFDNEFNIIYGLLPGMVVDRCGCS